MGDSKYICRGCSLEYDTLSDIFISNNSDNGPTIFRQQLLIVLHPLETVDTIFLYEVKAFVSAQQADTLGELFTH
ncbi:TPA: hypothetical protein ACTY0A_005419 [Klebsiella pneumoniae]